MPAVEVDQVQWNNAQNVVKTVAEIMKDPKRRKSLLALQKQAQPDIAIPEIDAAAPLEGALADITKKMEELRTEVLSDREKRDSDAQLAKYEEKQQKGRILAKSRNYNDDGIAAVEKLMTDRGIAEYEDAMAIYERLYPIQEPVKSTAASFLNKAKGPDADELSKMLIATRGQDNSVLDRMIDAIRREGTGG